ncbi:MAG TPA: DUF4964 domain-containing protein, partial [Saprospiraceae bacterium]|nr:DUF4964 domain-containing protein [Saprospiraceae bacterium]
MQRNICLFLAVCWALASFAQVERAPAYPLLLNDPYFSIWSFNDTLCADATRHWTGREHPL